MLYLEIIISLIFVCLYMLLHEKWKKDIEIPLLRHILIVIFRVAFCAISVLFFVFIFGYVLSASEIQLLLIVAVGGGVIIAAAYYITDRFHEQ